MVIKKNILITSGPTWVAIDGVRVISNIASGQTGFLLAREFSKFGYPVTLLMGPGNTFAKLKGVKVLSFKYFQQLKQLLDQELRTKKYAVVIQAAAVADYKLKAVRRSKISSALKALRLELIPTEKLIKNLKKYSADIVAIGFKFQPHARKLKLVKDGRDLLKAAQLDLVVANNSKNNRYLAYILENHNTNGPYNNKAAMAANLVKLIFKKIC